MLLRPQTYNKITVVPLSLNNAFPNMPYCESEQEELSRSKAPNVGKSRISVGRVMDDLVLKLRAMTGIHPPPL